MEKIYLYDKDEEDKINHELGYSSEQIQGAFHNQHQFSIGISDILGWFRWTFNRNCPCCNSKLEWKKELKYVGLRLPPNCTKASNLEKAYEVTRILVCPNCQSKYYIYDRRNK